MTHPIINTSFPDLNLIARGKVRDIYDLGDALLMVTSDRISAFDVIMNEPIPDKGVVLNQLSAFHFRQMADIVPNQLISIDVAEYPPCCQPYTEVLRCRSMLVKKAKPLPVECIVRGYLSGSGWKAYKAGEPLCGIKLPAGLVESDRLSEPIFTPSTKAELGTHDENITFERMVELLGDANLAERVRDIALRIYAEAHNLAVKKGIIIADTKFEFGIYEGELIIIDECLTPDSSRFWPMDQYKPGGSQPSFDKQFLRDYLETLVAKGEWDKTAPPPPLPTEIVVQTANKYREAINRLTDIHWCAIS